MGKVRDHRRSLLALDEQEWAGFLTKNSALPGPRANLELAAAVADEASPALIHRYAADGDEYLALCGALGLGRLVVEGDASAEARLRSLAEDSRWRVREGVAMGLQRVGDSDPRRLLSICADWLENGSWLVQRAVVAGLCEPRLLGEAGFVEEVLDMLDRVTANLAAASDDDRAGEDFRTVRKGLGYCWSVAIAALPDPGFDRFERWAGRDNRDLRWVVRENMGKARMRRANPDRWDRLRARLDAG
jgi:hypothetical protein